jgi:hypothetical protein
MGCIPFFIAILLLIILINVNIKEGFTTTTPLIDSNLDLIKNNLSSFQTNYLKDFKNNIKVALKNHSYDNVYNVSSDATKVDFSNYTYNYTQSISNSQNQKSPFVIDNYLEMNIDVSYTTIINSTSYNALINAIKSCEYIQNNINGNSLSKLDDINEYKMVSITLRILNDIKSQYDKFNIVFNNTFTDISGLNLLEYHQSIVEVIRGIEFATPILFYICIPYFNNKTLDYDLSQIKLNGENYGSIQNMMETKLLPDNYTRIINSYTNSFNDLLRPNVS